MSAQPSSSAAPHRALTAAAVAVVVLTCLIVFAAPLGTTVVSGVAALGLAVLAWRSGCGLPVPRIPAAAMVVFLAWGLTSALWSLDAGQTFKKAGQLTGVMLAAVLLVAAARALPAATRGPVRRAVAVGGAILVVATLLEGYLGLPVRHAAVALGLADETGAYVLNRTILMMVLLAWPAAIAAACLGRRRLALVLPPLAALGSIGLDSGTATLAGFGGLIGFGVAWLAAARGPVVVTSLFVAGSAVVVPLAARLHGWLVDVEALPTSLLHRFFIWEFAVDRIAERPLFGWGLEATRVMPNFGVESRYGAAGGDIIPLHTHNTYVQVMLETGLVGYAIFVGFVAWLMLRTRAWPPVERACGLGLLCAVAASWLTGFGAWQSWWLAGLVLAAFLTLAVRSPAQSAASPSTSNMV